VHTFTGSLILDILDSKTPGVNTPRSLTKDQQVRTKSRKAYVLQSIQGCQSASSAHLN
jgi:hypothetical protein